MIDTKLIISLLFIILAKMSIGFASIVSLILSILFMMLYISELHLLINAIRKSKEHDE